MRWHSVSCFFLATNLLSPNVCRADIEITILAGKTIEFQSTDVAEITYTSKVGDLALPPYLEPDLPPIFRSVTRYNTTTVQEGQKRISDISEALTFLLFTSETGQTPDVSFSFAVESASSYDPLYDHHLAAPLTAFLASQSTAWWSLFQQGESSGTLKSIRYSVPLTANIDDATLLALIDKFRSRPSTTVSYSIPLLPSGVISIPPNSPNGKDGLFHIIAPSATQDNVGNGIFPFAATTVCQPFLSYWQEVNEGGQLSPKDIQYLTSLNAPLSAEAFLEIAKKDCDDLESQIDIYRDYVKIAHNIMREMSEYYNNANSFDEVDSAISADIDALDFATKGPLGERLNVALHRNVSWMSSFYNAFADRRLPENAEQAAPSEISDYWVAHRPEQDAIQRFMFLPLLDRPIIRSRLFSVYISASDGSYADMLTESFNSAYAFSSATNKYKQRIALRLAELALTLQGLKRPSMMKVGNLQADATFADVVQQVGLLRLASELEARQDIFALFEELRETQASLTALNQFHRVMPDGGSSIWPDLPVIVELVRAPSGSIVGAGQTVATAISTQTYLAELSVGLSDHGLGPGTQLRVRLSADVPIPNAHDFLAMTIGAKATSSCLGITDNERREGMRRLWEIVSQRPFLIEIGGQVGRSDGTSTRRFSAEIRLEDLSPVSVLDTDLLLVAQCSGLGVSNVDGQVGVRADWGVLLEGQRYEVEIVRQ